MTQKIPYWHVDAFAARPFGGNQAAVMVLDEWLPDDVLVQIGGENLFAETAFVVRDTTGAADWELRWCTPTYEIALCGHATLASGHILLTRDGGERVTFRTRKSGILEVVRAGAGYELALPAIATAPDTAAHQAEAIRLLGAEPLEVFRSELGYNVYLYDDFAKVPVSNFNASAANAVQLWTIPPGSGATWSKTITAMSNETRVRVEFFSKIIASTLLLKGSGAVPWRNMALSSMARVLICCSSARLISLRVRKCLGAFGGTIITALLLQRAPYARAYLKLIH